ncbi:MAG: toll/interleukin-1 receptor domain-containing protein [Microcystaceae cyanobacterium]
MNTSALSSILKPHFHRLVKGIAHGKVIFFLGDEINLCGRGKTKEGPLESWRIDDNVPQYAPTNTELALYLDKKFQCKYSIEVIRCPLLPQEELMEFPEEDYDLPEQCPVNTGGIKKMALQQVSQYIDIDDTLDPYGTLPDILVELFDAEYSPNCLHQFLAKLPQLMIAKGYAHPYCLIVTACFDNTLERAFKEAEQPFDLVSFVRDKAGSRFVHQKFRSQKKSRNGQQIIPTTEPIYIDKPNEYDEDLSLNFYPIILKLYGAIDCGEHFVITEDNCLDYLAHRDIKTLLPSSLLKQLLNNCILFLGYSPSYWNQRVILHRIWQEEIFSYKSKNWWVIQYKPEILDRKFWKRYCGQEPINILLDDYIAELENELNNLRKTTMLKPTINGADKPMLRRRDQVFISYSHKDTEWLEKLQTMLFPVIQLGKVSIWDDTQIKPGAKWKEEIEKALDSAKVAVLLVSQNFLASDFITTEEMPPLLESAEKEGVKILWVYLNYCHYQYTALKNLQATHNISEPLEALSEKEQNKILFEISDEIITAIQEENSQVLV